MSTDAAETREEPADPLVGRILDRRYRVDGVARATHSGRVYAAFHLSLGTPVELEVLVVDGAVRDSERKALAERFVEESRRRRRTKRRGEGAVLDLGTVVLRPDEPPSPYRITALLRAEGELQAPGARSPFGRTATRPEPGRSRVGAAMFALVALGTLAAAIVTAEREAATLSAAGEPVATPDPRTLCDLADDELRQRVERAGYGVARWSREPGADGALVRLDASLDGRGDEVFELGVLDDVADHDGVREALRESVEDVNLVSPLAIAYSLQGRCLTWAKGPSSGVRVTLETVLAGLDLGAVGDTSQRIDPIGIERPRPAPRAVAKAAKLGDLSSQELVDRVLASGALVYDVEQVDDRRLSHLSIASKRNGERVRFVYMKSTLTRTLVTEELAGAKSTTYFAVDEDVAVLALGAADPSLLARVLDGLDATIVKSE